MFTSSRWWSNKRTPSPARASSGDLVKAEKIINAHKESSGVRDESPKGDPKFSAEKLRSLYAQVTAEQSITDQNSGDIVSALRSISEILIWGDKNDPSVFEAFLEKHMLAYFVSILRQCGEVFSKPVTNVLALETRTSSPAMGTASKVKGILTSRNASSDAEGKPLNPLSVKSAHHVCIQVLQLLHILFENISQDTSLYFLLSNNFINQIIGSVYDFTDDEILAHYVSLMKILSAKLNPHTIHFFYAEDLLQKNDSLEEIPFPLFHKALELFTHSETMVRIAARQVLLNIFRVKDASSNKSFVKNPDLPKQLISQLSIIMNNQAEQFSAFLREGLNPALLEYLPRKEKPNLPDEMGLLRQKLMSAWIDSQKRSNRLRDLIEEHESFLEYINDLSELGVEPLKSLLHQDFLLRYAFPTILRPICDNVSQLTHQTDSSDLQRACLDTLAALFFLNLTVLNLSDLTLVFPSEYAEKIVESFSQCLRIFEASESFVQDDRLPLLVLSFFTTLTAKSAAGKLTVPPSVLEFLHNRLVSMLVRFIHSIPQAGFRVCRPFVLRLACNLVESLVQTDGSYHIEDQDMAVLLDAKEQSCLLLRRSFKNDNNFINLVELEIHALKQQKPLQIDRILQREFISIFLFCPNPTLASIPEEVTTISSNSTHPSTPRTASEEKGFPDLCKRWPLTTNEECRYLLRVFLMLRRLSTRIQKSLTPSSGSFSQGLVETGVKSSSSNNHLEMPAPFQSVQVGDVVDISSCDTILSCQIIPFHTHLASRPPRPQQILLCPSDEEKWAKRFLIIHQWQMLLVEPDNKKVGFAVVRETFVLPAVQMLSEKEQRERIICCCSVALSANHRNHDVNALVGTDPKTMTKSIFLQIEQQLPVLLSRVPCDTPWHMDNHVDSCVRIMFDDSIRSMAATTRIKKNQERIRELKLGAIATLLDLPVGVGHNSSNLPDDTKESFTTQSSVSTLSTHRPMEKDRHHSKHHRRGPVMIHGAESHSLSSRSHSEDTAGGNIAAKTVSRGPVRDRPPKVARDIKSAPGTSIPLGRMEASGRSGFIERVEPE